MFRALIIGADGYFPNLLSNGTSYASLSACVNDARRVEAMLRARVTTPLAVTTLTATVTDLADDDESRWPTAKNIREALAQIERDVQPDDQVYIHYSGHGGRVITASKALKGNDGLDEALVPIDIGRPDYDGMPHYTRPERYIRDVELAIYLDRLASKGTDQARVMITLVFDSCHSGGATRRVGDLQMRCAPGGSVDRREPDQASDETIAAYRRLTTTQTRSANPAQTTWLPPARDYVLLAACRDAEGAAECSIDGRPASGVLTDALLDALTALGTRTWATIYQRVLARVQSVVPSQMPQLLGDIDRDVLGTALRPLPLHATVRAIDAATRTVVIDSGEALNVTRGTQIAIHAPGEDDFSVVERRIAVATVTAARAFESTAELAAGVAPAAIPLGAPAVPLLQALRRGVVVIDERAPPPPDTVAQAIEQAITRDGRAFLELGPARSTPSYVVAITPTKVEIADAHGNPFGELRPVIAVSDPAVGAAVLGQLARVARYQAVLAMTNPGDDLLARLDIELLVAPVGWKDGDNPAVGGTPLERSGDSYSVRSGTWLFLRIRNRFPTTPVNVALLNLAQDWEIDVVVPYPTALAGTRYETIANNVGSFAFRMTAVSPDTIDVLKLFVTTGDVDFSRIATRVHTRNAGIASTALDRLFDAIGDPTPTRAVTSATSTRDPWAVREFRMCTQP